MRAGTEDKLESASFPEEEKGIRRRKISSKSAEDRETDKKKILNTTNEEKRKIRRKVQAHLMMMYLRHY